MVANSSKIAYYLLPLLFRNRKIKMKQSIRIIIMILTGMYKLDLLHWHETFPINDRICEATDIIFCF